MTDTPSDVPRADVRLSAEQIADYDLKRVKRNNYDEAAVDDLLDVLAAQTGQLVEEVAALRADRERLAAQVDEASETESTLKRTLITAQRAAESSVQEAHEQAATIRERALARAEELLEKAAEQASEMREAALRRARADEAEARRRRRALDEHVAELRAFAEDHRERVAHHLRQQLDRLDAMELPTPPPPPGSDREDDELTTESSLEREPSEVVADLEANLVAGSTGESGHDDGSPGAVPPGVAADADLVAPPSAPPATDDVDLEDLLARVDAAAAEVQDTAGVVNPVDGDEHAH